MRILQVSAELFPLLKTGGLADVVQARAAAKDRASSSASPERRIETKGRYWSEEPPAWASWNTSAMGSSSEDR